MARKTRANRFESRLTEALSGAPGAWTPDCLSPEDLIGLVEQGGSYPNAAQLLLHATGCATCRREYAEMRRTLRLAAQARTLQTSLNQPAEELFQPEPSSSLESWIRSLRLRLGDFLSGYGVSLNPLVAPQAAYTDMRLLY